MGEEKYLVLEKEAQWKTLYKSYNQAIKAHTAAKAKLEDIDKLSFCSQGSYERICQGISVGQHLKSAGYTSIEGAQYFATQKEKRVRKAEKYCIDFLRENEFKLLPWRD